MGLTTPYVFTLNFTRVSLFKYSLALKFLFSSSKNLQSTHQEFNMKVKDVTDVSLTQEAKERNTLRQKPRKFEDKLKGTKSRID